MKARLHYQGNCIPFGTGIVPYDDIEELENSNDGLITIKGVYSIQQMLFEEYNL
jgi:hypothetical protein